MKELLRFGHIFLDTKKSGNPEKPKNFPNNNEPKNKPTTNLNWKDFKKSILDFKLLIYSKTVPAKEISVLTLF